MVEKKISKMLIVFIIMIIAALTSWMYIFNIYEVDILIDRRTISAGRSDSINVKLIPLNSFGFKTPFRSVDTKLKFLMGSELAEIKKKDECNFSLHPKSDSGKVIMLLESDYFLYPNKFTFYIKPSEAL